MNAELVNTVAPWLNRPLFEADGLQFSEDVTLVTVLHRDWLQLCDGRVESEVHLIRSGGYYEVGVYTESGKHLKTFYCAYQHGRQRVIDAAYRAFGYHVDVCVRYLHPGPWLPGCEAR